MKGEKTLFILQSIEEAIMDISDLMVAFLNAGYGASLGKMEYEVAQRRRRRLARQYEKEEIREKELKQKQQRQRFYEAMCRLENDGLIKKTSKKNTEVLKLTNKGRQRLATLKLREQNILPSVQYRVKRGRKFTIVAFDIPEAERRKRNWLRAALNHLGFKTIQKSVLVGQVKIPKEFMDDIKRLGLIDYLEIFEISKAGTLRTVAWATLISV